MDVARATDESGAIFLYRKTVPSGRPASKLHPGPPLHANAEEVDRWMSSYRDCLAEGPATSSQPLQIQETNLECDGSGLQPSPQGPLARDTNAKAAVPGPQTSVQGSQAQGSVHDGIPEQEPDHNHAPRRPSNGELSPLCEVPVPQIPGPGLPAAQEPALDLEGPHPGASQVAGPEEHGVTAGDGAASAAADRLELSPRGAEALVLEAENAVDHVAPASATARKASVWLYGCKCTSPGLAGMIHSARLEPEGARLRWA